MKKNILFLAVSAIAIICFAGSFHEFHEHKNSSPSARFEVRQRSAAGVLPPPKASVYRQSKSEQDENGIVSLVFDDGKRFYHPFNVATQALADNGVEGTAGLALETIVENKPKPNAGQLLALEWLIKNAKTLKNGGMTWVYPLPLYYPTFTVSAGWPSSFSQARIIHAFMYASITTQNPAYMEYAKKAALAYDLSLEDGGLLGKVDGYDFYEEVPLTNEYSPHILNGHLYSVVVLHELYNSTRDQSVLKLVRAGLESARILAPYFDTGYWTKYDLVPRVNDIVFIFRGTGLEQMKASLADHLGNEFPLVLSAVSNDIFTFKANLPGAIAYKYVIGHPGYTLKISDGDRVADVAIAGLRPEVNEFYSLSLRDIDNSNLTKNRTFHVPIQYVSAGVLSRVYQRWHARLMTRLGALTGASEFDELGRRWFEYDAALERDIQATASALTVRSVHYPIPSTTDSTKVRLTR